MTVASVGSRPVESPQPAPAAAKQNQKTAFNPTTAKNGTEKTAESSPNFFMKAAAKVGDLSINLGGILSVASLACPLLEPLSIGVNVVAAARQLSKGDTTAALSTLAQAIPGEGALGLAIKTASKTSECADSAKSLCTNVAHGNVVGSFKDAASITATVAGAGKYTKVANTAEKLAKGAAVAEHGHTALSEAGGKLKKGDVIGAVESAAVGAKNIFQTASFSRAGTVAEHVETASKAAKASHAKGDHLGTAKTMVEGARNIANTTGNKQLQTMAGHGDTLVRAGSEMGETGRLIQGHLKNGNHVAAAGLARDGFSNVVNTFNKLRHKEATGTAASPEIVTSSGRLNLKVVKQPEGETPSTPTIKPLVTSKPAERSQTLVAA